MNKILLFLKDFELGTKISSSCVDLGYSIDFSDENTDPDTFGNNILLAFVDLDEKVFSSVGLVSELKRRKLKVVGIMNKIKNQYLLVGKLFVSKILYNFVNKELLKKTKIKSKQFWSGLEKSLYFLRDKNEIASIDKFKIFISVGDFFSFNEA